MSNSIQYEHKKTSNGNILIAKSEKGICWLSFTDELGLNHSKKELQKTFPNASLTPTTNINENDTLDLNGTLFQHQVWNELKNIPKGETRTYQDIANAIGKPKAVRAVGTAIGRNPISLLVPCHRVILKSGKIHNYRWGTETKKSLLKSEHSL